MAVTIAVVAPGAMGAAVGARLVRNGAVVLTSTAGRSAASKARAEAAGMREASDERIAAEAALFLSIVPPADAPALAERFAATIARDGSGPILVDCNAVAVSTVQSIAGTVERSGGRCVDGAIIGGPPKGDEAGPTFYVSGSVASDALVLQDLGLDVKLIDGPIGAASALKLSYAGITKGLVAIAAAMTLAADRAGAGAALKHELAASQPQLLARFEKTLPDMYPKAYRWVEEMRAIAEFIGPEFPEAQIFGGAAELYERIAADVAGDGLETGRIDSFLAS